mgnify:CR=1 FL=1
MILNSERKTEKLLEIAEDIYSKQRVDGRLDISDVELRSLNKRCFYEVNFNNVRFTGDIRDTYFRSCKFTNCQMASANFLKTQIVGGVFTDCELLKPSTAFNECDLIGIKIENCNMDYVKFCFASLIDVYMTGCSLKHADFGRAKLSNARFVECNMSEAVFDETEFNEAEFKESDLTKLSAKRIVLKGPIISLTIEDCNHEGMVVTTNQIQFMNKCEVTKMWPEGLKNK